MKELKGNKVIPLNQLVLGCWESEHVPSTVVFYIECSADRVAEAKESMALFDMSQIEILNGMLLHEINEWAVKNFNITDFEISQFPIPLSNTLN